MAEVEEEELVDKKRLATGWTGDSAVATLFALPPLRDHLRPAGDLVGAFV